MSPSFLLLDDRGGPGYWLDLTAALLVCLYIAGASLATPEPAPAAAWFPEQPLTRVYDWHYAPCPGCVALKPPPAWLKMRDLAGLHEVHFLRAPNERLGPAYALPPDAVAVSPEGVALPTCQLNFLVGHELVHIAQRHFDEDASVAAVLSGLAPDWTDSGKRALSLLDDNFALALRMSPFWQQQEREADWVGMLLSAQASGCQAEEGALAYLREQRGYGGGLAAAHEESAARVAVLSGFAEAAARLAVRPPAR